MRIIKQVIQEHIEKKYLYKWNVPSKSNKGTFHIVRSDGKEYICDCMAFKTGTECSHIKELKI